jgi:hypothetical protein
MALRARVSGTVAQAGWMLLSLGVVPRLLWSLDLPLMEDSVASTQLAGYFLCFLVPGATFLLLALSPVNATAIRAVCILLFFLNVLVGVPIILLVAWRFRANTSQMCIWSAVALLMAWGCVLLWPTLNKHPRDCGSRRDPMPPRLALRRLWLVMRSLASSGGIALFVISLISMADPCTLSHPFAGFYLLVAVLSLGGALLTTTTNRGRVIRWLGSLGTHDSALQNSASVASLIGQRSAAEAYVAASRNFRAQPLSTLTRHELMDNEPDPALHAKTIAAELGEVDAFASHSWSDEGSAKYDGLHEFAAELQAEGKAHVDDVLIWLDKACIDQSNIDEALAGLPVFLAACKQLLVLAGPTYTSRLWWYAIADRTQDHGARQCI